MSRYRFVDPETTRLDLTDGDWIEVKVSLTIGEARRVAERSKRAIRPVEGKDATVDSDLDPLALIEEYVTAWSFVDAKGRQTKPTHDTIRALDQPTYGEIIVALGKHLVGAKETTESDPIAAAPAPTST